MTTKVDRPFFSIIVPVHNVEAFLRPCLLSILRQSYRDFELLCVDNGSTDHSRWIVEELADHDERVRPILLGENTGPGEARNRGFQEATGDYIVFVDSDDLLTKDALQKVADRIVRVPADIVIFDYARLFWDEKRKRNRRTLPLKSAEVRPHAFNLVDEPALLLLLQVVWNKAYRRDFLEEIGLVHPPGYYEDTVYAYTALIAAESITAINEVLYLYRQRRGGGNILHSISRRHFDVFDQYDRLFGWLEEHPEHERWRADLVGRMTVHFITIMKNARVPGEDEREFFEKAVRYVRYHWDRSGYQPPEEHDVELQQALYAGNHDSYRGIMLSRLDASVRSKAEPGRMRSAVRGRAIRFARGGLRRLRRLKASAVERGSMAVYRRYLREPIDENLAVFAAYWYRGYSCNPKAISEYALEHVPGLHAVWVIDDTSAGSVPSNVEVVRPGTRRYFEVLARAKWLVNNVNFPNHVVKRKGSIHIQTQHGTPLKTMGLDMQAFKLPSKSTNFRRMLERADRWDFNLSSNAHSTEVWGRAFPVAAEILEFGYPRNDVLVREREGDRAERRRALNLPQDGQLILFAPTYRDYSAAFMPNIDLARLADILGPDTTIMVRSHYFLDGTEGPVHDRVIDVSAYEDVNDLYLASDLLITDYSSSMFDYALLRRPIVLYIPDLERYTRKRGLEFDLRQHRPGPLARTPSDLAAVLVDREYLTATEMEAADRFRERFCKFDDGHAAERVVRRLFLNEPLPSRWPELRAAERSLISG
jgi:CDP-glycerol glycerophosphotransferase (TagB/SpsB family)/GT2 family glycosyltransferase